MFLFKFASRNVAEQVIAGKWCWKNFPLRLQWWNSVIGVVEDKDKPNTTWVRICGLPFHLWSQKVFRAIGKTCGGWVETEEET
ncbi:hypothetical protein KY289_001403 [Solanum tuberosum]|nr:hypothetical protein KY289_001403 [Solanum tuberosum]